MSYAKDDNFDDEDDLVYVCFANPKVSTASPKTSAAGSQTISAGISDDTI